MLEFVLPKRHTQRIDAIIYNSTFYINLSAPVDGERGRESRLIVIIVTTVYVYIYSTKCNKKKNEW